MFLLFQVPFAVRELLKELISGSLGKDVFVQRTSTGSEVFSFEIPRRYKICITKFLYCYGDDLLKNLGKSKSVLLNVLNTQAKSYLQFFQIFSIHLSLLELTPKNLKYLKLYLSSKLTTRPTLLIIGQFHYYQIPTESSKKLCTTE